MDNSKFLLYLVFWHIKQFSVSNCVSQANIKLNYVQRIQTKSTGEQRGNKVKPQEKEMLCLIENWDSAHQEKLVLVLMCQYVLVESGCLEQRFSSVFPGPPAQDCPELVRNANPWSPRPHTTQTCWIRISGCGPCVFLSALRLPWCSFKFENYWSEGLCWIKFWCCGSHSNYHCTDKECQSQARSQDWEHVWWLFWSLSKSTVPAWRLPCLEGSLEHFPDH